MRRRPLVAGLAALAVAALPGCSRDEARDAAACVPGGTRVEVEARNLAFRPTCLAAPADTPFTIELRNRDSLPHDVAIKRDAEARDDLFRGETVQRGRTTYRVPALPAGTWVFYCTVHPQQMTGRFVAA